MPENDGVPFLPKGTKVRLRRRSDGAIVEGIVLGLSIQCGRDGADDEMVARVAVDGKEIDMPLAAVVPDKQPEAS